MRPNPSAYSAVKAVPSKVVLPTADLLKTFHARLGSRELTNQDVREILAQIVCVLLNSDEKTDEGLLKLPEVDRLIYFNRIDQQDAQLLDRIDKVLELQVFQSAVHELALAVRTRLLEFGAYRDQEFPYFFDGMLGSDIMLSHLPY